MLMAATNVFPFAGAGMVTAQELLAPLPVLAMVVFILRMGTVGCAPIEVSAPSESTKTTQQIRQQQKIRAILSALLSPQDLPPVAFLVFRLVISNCLS
jgi:hypothetical protein